MTETYSDKEEPELVECNVDRIHTGMESDYLPEAPGILIAGQDLLRAAGYRAGMPRPFYWKPAEPGKFMRPRLIKTGNKLWVSNCGEYWLVERTLDSKMGTCRTLQTLVFAFLPLPICTRTPEAAMCLANYCDRIPKVPVPGRWAKVWRVRDTNYGQVCTPATP
jgi:hypothetical protein